MNLELKANKQILREFMREQYSDERLVMLLDHARANRLRFYSCCCFIGSATSNHPGGKMRSLVSERILEARVSLSAQHLNEARTLRGADQAENAFAQLGRGWSSRDKEHDDCRRRILIPMILAELKRRNRQQNIRVCNSGNPESVPSEVR